jgi:transcription elongation factor GreA
MVMQGFHSHVPSRQPPLLPASHAGHAAAGQAVNGPFHPAVGYAIVTNVEWPTTNDQRRMANGERAAGSTGSGVASPPATSSRDKEQKTLAQAPKARFKLTVQGFNRLQTEMEELQKRRVEVAGHIRTAKGFGDLSENFEYHEAKREAGFVEGRLQELKQILPTALVVPSGDVRTDAIDFGAVVRVRDLSLDEEWDYWIVGPLEADPENDRISYESPLGAAFLGRKVSDVVEVSVPAGVARYEILDIRPYDE